MQFYGRKNQVDETEKEKSAFMGCSPVYHQKKHFFNLSQNPRLFQQPVLMKNYARYKQHKFPLAQAKHKPTIKSLENVEKSRQV